MMQSIFLNFSIKEIIRLVIVLRLLIGNVKYMASLFWTVNVLCI